MTKIKSVVPNVLCALLMICAKCQSEPIKSEAFNFNQLSFEQIKNDLFIDNFNISIKNDAKCFTELNAIKNGLTDSEQWSFESKLNFKFAQVHSVDMN